MECENKKCIYYFNHRCYKPDKSYPDDFKERRDQRMKKNKNKENITPEEIFKTDKNLFFRIIDSRLFIKIFIAAYIIVTMILIIAY